MSAAQVVGRDRKRLNFAHLVEARFGFVLALGYSEVESNPTIVRFRKDGLTCTVYHGRRSFEIGVEIELGEERYSMSELIRSADPVMAEQYRNPTAATAVELAAGLERVANLMQRFGALALLGDPSYFAELRQQRATWSESYALDVLAEQTRPKAESAFREGRYREAAALYEKIALRLSRAEQKKLAIARKRM
jgi:hypothetical protein